MSDLLLDKIKCLIDEVRALNSKGLQKPFYYVNDTTFLAEEFTTKTIAFQISEDADFVCTSIHAYLDYRYYVQSTGVIDKSFRPVSPAWTSALQGFAFGFTFDAALTFSENYVDKGGRQNSRALSNIPIPLYHFYSSPLSNIDAVCYVNKFRCPTPWELRRGSSVDVGITPIASNNTYITTSSSDDPAPVEYRLTVVLEGVKQ